MPDPIADSVRQRLLNLARSTGDDYNQILVRYVGLRFLVRLARSPHGASFLLKGATMFLVWSGSMHRPTRDVDLLGFTQADGALIGKIMQEVCGQPCDPDGLIFDPHSVRVESIRENAPYEGLRCVLTACLGSARLTLQLDVGFGDAVTPEPSEVDIPRLLASEKPTRIRAYTPETVVAEKFEAMVRLGLQNSRMKDFFDLMQIFETVPVDKPVLALAIRRTFTRRKTDLPEGIPLALTDTFWTHPPVVQRWKAFTTKNRLGNLELREVCERIQEQLGPVLDEVRNIQKDSS